LNVAKGVSINGQGFCIKGTNTHVFQIATEEPVVMEDLVIYSAKDSKGGQGINVAGVANATPSNAVFRNNADLTLNNVTINTTARGMNIINGDGIKVELNNCIVQNVQGQSVDEKGNPTSAKYDIELTSTNAGNSRAINFGHITNSTITVNNSTLQGFFYVMNNVTGYDPDNGIMTGTKVIANNSTFKGRAALNAWGFGGNYEFSDCTVVGINNYGSSQESFACFVFNDQGTCHDNTLTINGGTVVSAVFNETGSSNPNARQFFVSNRGTNNAIVINNASYTCDKTLGDNKGGIVEYQYPGGGNSVTINGGSYDCPEIIQGNYSTENTLVINGGDFNVNTVSDWQMDAFPIGMCASTEINGGTFVIADGTKLNDLSMQYEEENPETGETETITLSVLPATAETYTNQNGTVSVVPAGTEAATSQAAAPEIEWNDPEDWTVPSASSNVVIAANQTVTLEGAAGAAYRLDMGDGAKLIVKEGTTLTIGKGGVALFNGGAVKPQIIIEQGAKVITYGLMYNSVAENLIIKASAAKHGVLLIDPNAQAFGDNHPMGTVEFVTKSFFKDNDHYQFERFGIPTWNTLESIDCDVDGLSTGIYIYENNGWQDLGYLKKGVAFKNIDRLNKPFVACNLIAYQEAAGAAYKFAGSLMGNSDAALNANLEWNPFANSYTGDVDIIKYLEGLASGVNVDRTVYLAKPTGLGTYSWDPVDAEWAAGEKLAPMQAFILHNHGQEAEVSAIDYSEMVWAPGSAASAPRRSAAASDNTAKLRIIVSNEQGAWDNVKMTESATNMHNATKYMNDEVNIYAMADEKCGIIATDNLENTYVGFSTVNGGKYTISFANVEGREFTLVDHETGAQVAMAEGNKYEFTAAANSANDYRFEIVESAKLPTAIENTEAVKSVKGIYTITGQFLGEMNVWNTLPAGVYVVNGEKRVK
jgi:hypothetical protein